MNTSRVKVEVELVVESGQPMSADNLRDIRAGVYFAIVGATENNELVTNKGVTVRSYSVDIATVSEVQ